MDKQVLLEQLHSFISGWGMDEAPPEVVDREFERLALMLFARQFQMIPAYRRYCQTRGKVPMTVRRWQDIPPMPIQAFKALPLSCESPEQAEAIFMTSGTTQADHKGRHYHPSLAIWDASMIGPFRHYVLPDHNRMTMLVLSPTEDCNKNSSLSRYLSRAVAQCGSPYSECLYDCQTGLQMARVFETITRLIQIGEPILLMGATFAYVHVLDACEEAGLRFTLPPGSRLFDTGGLKGQAREIAPQAFYESIKQCLGLERDACMNMYGMTELSSQLYDTHFVQARPGESGAYAPGKQGGRWIRSVVLDPDTLQPVADGQRGVIAHYDLANWNATCAILTEDMGRITERGLELLGRVSGSEARGCSIAVDQLLQATRGIEK